MSGKTNTIDDYVSTFQTVTTCDLITQTACWDEANNIVTRNSQDASYDPDGKWKKVKKS